MAHTPGPWQFWDNDGGQAVCIAGDPQSGKEICECVVHNHESEANARLIAAAPELLEALTGLVAIIDGTCEPSMWMDEDRTVFLSCKAALAKATGE